MFPGQAELDAGDAERPTGSRRRITLDFLVCGIDGQRSRDSPVVVATPALRFHDENSGRMDQLRNAVGRTGEFRRGPRAPVAGRGHPRRSELTTVKLSCIADDAQGEQIEVLWDAEIGASVLEEDAWSQVGRGAPDSPEVLAAYVKAIRWRSATAADRDLLAGAVPRRHPARCLSAAAAAQGVAASAGQPPDRRRRRSRQDGRSRAWSRANCCCAGASITSSSPPRPP